MLLYWVGDSWREPFFVFCRYEACRGCCSFFCRVLNNKGVLFFTFVKTMNNKAFTANNTKVRIYIVNIFVMMQFVFNIILMFKSRVVKMGWNSRANPAHHGFGLGWVEIFLQISIWVDFLPGSSGLNPW